MSLLEEGFVVRDTYEVERLLGEGAFAEVYRVRHRALGRQAMKVFKRVGLTLADIDEMLQEAQLLSSLAHPNIIRLFEANTLELRSGTAGYFTMEYIYGGNLEQFCGGSTTQLLPVATSVDLIRQVCSGLSVAHAKDPPIIHRDVKPANLLVSPAGEGWRVHIGDFGLAKRVSRVTGVTEAHGSLAFKPPEALHGLGMDSCAGDVWAVGCTMYLLLTRQFPYPEPRGRDAWQRRRFELLTPARDLNLEVDPELDQILARALARDGRQRYSHAGALLEDLKRWKPRGPDRLRTGTAPAVSAPAEEEARRLLAEAVRCARQARQLPQAAELLEQACQRWPPLRAEYEEQIQLWRRGIVS
jgi:serine/threonine-protein kinase